MDSQYWQITPLQEDLIYLIWLLLHVLKLKMILLFLLPQEDIMQISEESALEVCLHLVNSCGSRVSLYKNLSLLIKKENSDRIKLVNFSNNPVELMTTYLIC